MLPHDQVAEFIRSNFRSVWALELLLLLMRSGERTWRREELVGELRASDSVVATGLDALFAAGLVVLETDGAAAYRPASADLAALAESAQMLYSQRPDAVRRLIVVSGESSLIAFADAFKLRGD